MFRNSRLPMVAMAAVAVLAFSGARVTAGPMPTFEAAFAASAGTVAIEKVQVRRPGGVFRRGNGGRTALGLGLAVGALGALAAGAIASQPPPQPTYEEPLYGHPREPIYMRQVPQRRVIVEEDNEPLYGHPREPVYMRQARSGGDPYNDCARRYRSYNPQTGTYVGFDGLPRRCP